MQTHILTYTYCLSHAFLVRYSIPSSCRLFLFLGVFSSACVPFVSSKASLATGLPAESVLEIKLDETLVSCCGLKMSEYLRPQTVQQGEDGKEAAQRVSHVLLHHLPPYTQADESHQAECLETYHGSCLPSAGEPEHGKKCTTGEK